MSVTGSLVPRTTTSLGRLDTVYDRTPTASTAQATSALTDIAHLLEVHPPLACFGTLFEVCSRTSCCPASSTERSRSKSRRHGAHAITWSSTSNRFSSDPSRRTSASSSFSLGQRSREAGFAWAIGAYRERRRFSSISVMPPSLVNPQCGEPLTQIV